ELQIRCVHKLPDGQLPDLGVRWHPSLESAGHTKAQNGVAWYRLCVVQASRCIAINRKCCASFGSAPNYVKLLQSPSESLHQQLQIGHHHPAFENTESARNNDEFLQYLLASHAVRHTRPYHLQVPFVLLAHRYDIQDRHPLNRLKAAQYY